MGTLDVLISARRRHHNYGSLNDRNISVNSNDGEANCSTEETSALWPPRKQDRHVETVEIGSMNVLSSKYESLDYDTCENHLFLDEVRKNGYAFVAKKSLARWFIFLGIGVCTAFIGIFIDISIEILSDIKYNKLKKFVDDCTTDDCLYVPYFVWVAMNVFTVLVGSVLVTYVEPVALGSGIPQVKCYLNGIKMPRLVRIKTLIVKSIGVISAVVGGLAGGKEGPMIHSGAVVAAGISQGKSTTLKKDFGIFSYFREDHEKRDFVSGGAAAGVAAAFGAPVADCTSHKEFHKYLAEAGYTLLEFN